MSTVVPPTNLDVTDWVVGHYSYKMVVSLQFGRALGLALMCGIGACDATDSEPLGPPVFVRVTIANVSAPGALQTTQGAQDVLLSAGVWSVHDLGAPLIDPGASAPAGIELLAEEGDPTQLFADLMDAEQEGSVGTFGSRRPGENYAENPLSPGEAVEFSFWAEGDQALSFGAMFGASNDVLVGLGDGDGVLIHELEVGETRDISSAVQLWDVGTERNEEPGVGASQPGQQMGVGAGEAEGGTVMAIDEVDVAGYRYPAVASFVRVTVERSE